MAEEGMESLELVLERLEEISSDEETEESQFLTSYFNSRELQNMIEVYDLLTVRKLSARREKGDTLGTLRSVLATLDQLTEESEGAAELHEILVSPHLRALLECYDDVLNDRFTPELDPLPASPSLVRPMQAHRSELSAANSEMTLTSDSTHPVRGDYREMYKTVALRKMPDETLGITVVRHEYAEGTQVRSAIVVERILTGSVIDRQGMISVGDIILEVNGQPIDTPEALQRLMRQNQSQTISIKVMPMGARPPQMERKTYMKAYFSYTPSKDSLIPCRDAGLSFEFGDILEMVNQDDPHWWQARHIGTEGPHAGLVPSQILEERRKAFRPMPDTMQNYSVMSCGPFGRRNNKKKNVHVFRARDATTCFQDSDIWIYEEVRQISPARPPVLILIGAKGVGRRGVKKVLCRQWPKDFAQPVVWTTRPMSSDPEEMAMFRHVDREEMEACAREGGMLEWGKDGVDYYGISFDSVREIVRTGRTAVIDCQPQAVRLLRTTEFQPYVAFLAVPAVDVQKQMYNKGLQTGATRQIKTDDSFRRAMEESCHLERSYRQLFDFMVLNDDIPRGAKSVANNYFDVSSKPRWVPVNWALDEEVLRSSSSSSSSQPNGSVSSNQFEGFTVHPAAPTRAAPSVQSYGSRGPPSVQSYESRGQGSVHEAEFQVTGPQVSGGGPPSVQSYGSRGPPSVQSYGSRGPPSVQSYGSRGPPSVQSYGSRGPPSVQSYGSRGPGSVHEAEFQVTGPQVSGGGPPSVQSYGSRGPGSVQSYGSRGPGSVQSYGSRGPGSEREAESSGATTPVPQDVPVAGEDEDSTDFDTSSDSEDDMPQRRKLVKSPAS